MALAVMTRIMTGAAAATWAFALEQQSGGQPDKGKQKEDQGHEVIFHRHNDSKDKDAE